MSGVLREAPRALFADLVREATDGLDPTLSPMAISYVVELLEAMVLAPEPQAEGDTLGEALLHARSAPGPQRIASLRAVGDRSLFVAGFFGDSLWRRGLSDRYYQQIGCEAYASLSCCLSDGPAAGWPALFRELAARFPCLVELLGEVGDQTRGEDCGDLFRIYVHYAETGSKRDRARLLRRGVVPVHGPEWGKLQ